MIKAVLFDMDGVITDTEKYYYECWPKSLPRFRLHGFYPPRTPSSSAASITRTPPSGAAAVLARISLSMRSGPTTIDWWTR